MTQKVEIEIPDELSDELRPYQGSLTELLRLGLRQQKIAEALVLYSRGTVSFARAAELAGVPREQLIRYARDAGIAPRWSEETAREELA